MRSSALDRLLRRIRTLHLVVLCIQIGIIVLGGFLVRQLTLQIADRFLFYHPVVSVILAGSVFLIILGRSVALFLANTEQSIASQLDQKYALKERLTTYVELRETDHPFFEALSHEAESKISGVSPIAAVRWRSNLMPVLSILTFLIASIFLLPYLPVPTRIETRKQQQKQIKEEASALQEAVRKLQEKKPERREIKKLLAEFQKTAEELEKPATNKLDALRNLNLLQEKLKKADKELAESNRLELEHSLQEAIQRGGPPGFSDPNEKLEREQLAKELEQSLGSEEPPGSKEIREALSSRQLSRQEIDRLKKALEKYKAESAESAKTLAELQRSLEGAQKGMTGSHRVVTDSKISERNLEKGKGGVEDGPGTTNQDVGPQRFDTKKKEAGEYAEDRTKAEYEKLYKGERVEAASESLFVNSKWNHSAEMRYTRIRTLGLESEAAVEGSVQEPAEQNPDESEIHRERIPASYQKLVKKYFESIHD